MTDRVLPDNIKSAVDILLKCGDAEFQWLQMGIGLMLKAIVAEITGKFLSKEPGDLLAWICQVDRTISVYSREDLAKMILRWYNTMEDFKAAP